MATKSSEEEDAVWSTVVPQTFRADRGNIRRSFDPLAHPELGLRGCRTLYEGFRRGASVNPLGPCMGFRAVSTTGFATPYIYTSYSECLARADSFSAGLETLKLVEPTDDGMLVLCLYMKNCTEWILAEQATFALGGATVPFYDTLGPDTVRFILNQTGAQTVVCTRGELENLCKVKKSSPELPFSNVIVVNGVTPEAAQKAEAAGLQILSYAKVEAVGAHRIATQGHKHNPPNPKDVATFCYTSGTTGDPKGALITHENIVSAMAGLSAFPDLVMELSDRHLSYLPLAHIFERVVISQVFLCGASVGFFRGDPTLLIEDMQACRPTIMPVAPRVLNKIYDKVRRCSRRIDYSAYATACVLLLTLFLFTITDHDRYFSCRWRQEEAL